MASIGLSRTQLSTSGLQVGDLKASVTPSLHRCCVDVSVSCSCAHLQGQHDARSRPLLLRSLGPKVSEGTRHHRHALDGLPRRKPCTTAVWDESVSFPRLTTTYVWTSPAYALYLFTALATLLLRGAAANSMSIGDGVWSTAQSDIAIVSDRLIACRIAPTPPAPPSPSPKPRYTAHGPARGCAGFVTLGWGVVFTIETRHAAEVVGCVAELP